MGDEPLAETMQYLYTLLKKIYNDKTVDVGPGEYSTALNDYLNKLDDLILNPDALNKADLLNKADDLNKAYKDKVKVDDLNKSDDLNLKELPLQLSDEPNPHIGYDSVRSAKRMSRQYSTEYTGGRLSVTTVRNLYLTAHLTRADLSIMTDFEDFKDKLSIVGKEFVTMGKGFDYDGSNVHLRDTMLLAPGNQKSLKAIGNLYGVEFNKKDLTIQEISNMDKLLLEDRNKFLEYSKMDAIIPLIHSLAMEKYN